MGHKGRDSARGCGILVRPVSQAGTFTQPRNACASSTERPADHRAGAGKPPLAEGICQFQP